MGIEIDRKTFSASDFERFARKLELDLAALESLLQRPGFGEGPVSLGAELELYLIDAGGEPQFINEVVCAEVDDPALTLELNRYNLEYNLNPYPIAGALPALEQEILDKLQALRTVAARHGATAVPIGILPTLSRSHFGSHSITDRMRYHALVEQLIRKRGSAFRIDISGRNPLRMDMHDITLEGANTSFQLHVRVSPAQFASSWNTLQLITPLVLALSGNSPTLFGHALWQETRIPLFKQSIDSRQPDRYRWHEPARVSFGHGWLRRDPLELFAESVRLYPPLLPACAGGEEGAAGAPALEELRLHLSTVWLWNRPVYDPAGGGHLRIEIRALPAGPTAVDMLANAALLLGLLEALRPDIDALLPALPFGIAEYNFYRAAQLGLDARLVWPDRQQQGLREYPVAELIRRLLPRAGEGLARLGVAQRDIGRYLGVLETRLHSAQTGARWQLQKLHLLGREHTPEAARAVMLDQFRELSERNLPVAQWPL